MENRKSGILLHITSLPSDYGVGDLGPTAYRFVDFLQQAGQGYWQVLPLNPTAFFNSPYSSPSAFAFNSCFISLKVDEHSGDIKVSGSEQGAISIDTDRTSEWFHTSRLIGVGSGGPRTRSRRRRCRRV